MGKGARLSDAGRAVRRHLLSGGLVGVVAGLLGRSEPAAAADGDFVVLGSEENVATRTTGIARAPAPDEVRAPPALRLWNPAGSAIVGSSGDPSVIGDASSDTTAVFEGPQGALVIAGRVDPKDLAVGEPAGVRAVTGDPAKTAIQALHLSGGLALDVLRGKTRLATARSVMFPAGQTSLQVFDPDVTARSLIMAMFQGDTGNAVLRSVRRRPGVGFVAEATHRLREPAELGYVIIESGGAR